MANQQPLHNYRLLPVSISAFDIWEENTMSSIVEEIFDAHFKVFPLDEKAR